MTHDLDHDHNQTNNSLSGIIFLIGGIIALLLGVRFILLLFGISNVQIANFIYSTTDIFVRPFYGLFGRQFISGTPRIEFESIIALFVVWLIVTLLGMVFRSFR